MGFKYEPAWTLGRALMSAVSSFLPGVPLSLRPVRHHGLEPLLSPFSRVDPWATGLHGIAGLGRQSQRHCPLWFHEALEPGMEAGPGREGLMGV